jgi:beta-glucosidase
MVRGPFCFLLQCRRIPPAGIPRRPNLYVCDQISSVTRPVQELKGCRRVILAPGESRAIEFESMPEQLSVLDAQLERRAEPGLFVLMVGGSSKQLQTVLLEVTA